MSEQKFNDRLALVMVLFIPAVVATALVLTFVQNLIGWQP